MSFGQRNLLKLKHCVVSKDMSVKSKGIGIKKINASIKNDQGKPDLSLVPRSLQDGAARAFEFGAVKYGRYNYLNGLDWHRLIAATMRHVTAFNDGEDRDPETGLSHLDHAAASLAMLMEHVVKNLGTDTRHKKGKE